MNGSVYLAEVCSNPKSTDNKKYEPSVPEDLGKVAANRLLEEICRVRHLHNTNKLWLLSMT